MVSFAPQGWKRQMDLRAVTHLYCLELSCDQSSNQQKLYPTAPVLRPLWDAAVSARSRIQEVTEIESQQQV